MAPLKFEEHSRHKLDQRKIDPSPEGWERLSAQLSANEKSKKRGFVWYGVAAAFIGILVLSILQTKPEEWQFDDPNASVEIPVNTEIENQQNSKTLRNDVHIGNEVTNANVTLQDTDTPKSAVAIETIDAKEEVLDHTMIQETPIQAVVENNTMLEDKIIEIEMTKQTEKIIQEKITEVLAEVSLLEEGNALATDMEVDSLLRSAQREILASTIFNEDQSVDASALLLEAERELDRSFRDQIFEALKSGYFKAKTAVANRNN